MHPEHRRMLEALKAAAGPADPAFDAQGYHGSAHPVLNVKVPARRAIARAWVASHRDWSLEQARPVIESLLDGATHDEKTQATLLIGASRRLRQEVGPKDVERWLDRMVGWAEVDSLCQNLFPPEQLLADWGAWRAMLESLAADRNINKRRAALVLLTGPVHRSPDPRLSTLAFALIEQLKAEKPILITKAVSWLLRSLTTHHRAEVAAYLDANAPTLPAIAVRETRTKLATGKKTARAR